MTIDPTWDQYMAAALQSLLDGQTRKSRDICNAAADILGVSSDTRKELIPSGQPRYINRGAWALSYLFRAKAVERPARGQYRITPVGNELLKTYPGGITEADLRTLPGYESPRSRKTSPVTPKPGPPDPEPELSPTEQIEAGVNRLHFAVAEDLLTRLHGNDPEFFEQAVLDLIMAMGYGGAEGTATRTQLSNDGGIDGIVDQDALGLSRIYVQAKRFALDATIDRPAIQAFVGALHGNQANQGVFITTARFSAGARAYADSVPTRVVLIDGKRMASLMIRYGVGVQVNQTVHIVEVDEDFFE